MKFYFKLALLFLFPLCGFAQNLSDATTFKKTLELAKKKEKLVLLIINPDIPPEMMAKIPANPGLQEDVAQKIKENFVVFDTKRTDTSIRSIVAKHKITRFPAYLFMHTTTDLFHIEYGFSPNGFRYTQMLEKAMLMSTEKTVTTLENEHRNNPTDFAILKQLIDSRKRSGVTDNAELIEKYVQGLKISDFNDYKTVLYVLEAGPYSDGNAYKLAYTNRKITDSIYKNETIQVRSKINGAIISNTMATAIKARNTLRALNAANLSRSMSGRDYVRGNKIYNSQMLYYYSSIKDTTNYFKLAVQHFDMYYMNLSADSIKKAEAKERALMLERIKPTVQTPTVSKEKMDSLIRANPTKVYTRTESVVTSSSASNYANDLNNVAYQFYQTKTKNLNYLSKAMLWSKRALELNPIWAYYDTLAHVYYAMGIHSEAMATQKIAVDLAKKENNPEYFTRTNQELEKMKNKSL